MGRTFKEWLSYQWKPFEGTVGCADFAEREEQPAPGYWRKGRFLRSVSFWIGVAVVLLLALP